MADFPELARYERVKSRGGGQWSWPLKDLLMAHLKYTSAQSKRRTVNATLDTVGAVTEKARKTRGGK